MSPDWTMPSSIDTFILPGMSPHRPTSTTRTRPALRAKPAPAAARKTPAPEALPSAEDDSVLRGCLDGVCEQSQSALGQFYDLTVSRVYSVALRIVRRTDLAEEVVSDVYVQVWRDAQRYDDTRGKVLGWLLVIARSRALDLLRRQDEAFSHPEPYELVTEPESNHSQPEDLLSAAQAGSALHAALEKLNPLQRQLLSLAFFRGFTHSEIVEHMDLPLGTVKTHIRRALEILRKTLGPAADIGELS
jgi:RNA polymerase sigma factor (sigma-70 family)